MYNFTSFLLYYLLILNALGLLLMMVDKSRARKKLRRISEVNLFTIAAAGGAIGEIIAMYMFRHKTKKWKFYVGHPIMATIHIILVIALML